MDPVEWQHLKPTAKQLEFASSLGIAVDEATTRAEMSQLIDEALDHQRAGRSGKLLADATPGDMAEELFRRGRGAALIHWELGDDRQCSTAFADEVGLDAVQAVVVKLGAEWLKAAMPAAGRRGARR